MRAFATRTRYYDVGFLFTGIANKKILFNVWTIAKRKRKTLLIGSFKECEVRGFEQKLSVYTYGRHKFQMVHTLRRRLVGSKLAVGRRSALRTRSAPLTPFCWPSDRTALARWIICLDTGFPPSFEHLVFHLPCVQWQHLVAWRALRNEDTCTAQRATFTWVVKSALNAVPVRARRLYWQPVQRLHFCY